MVQWIYDLINDSSLPHVRDKIYKESTMNI